MDKNDDEVEAESEVEEESPITNDPFPEGSIGVIMTRQGQTWESSQAIIEEQNGRMFTVSELQAQLKRMGALLTGQDQWVATIRADGKRDWS